MDSSAANALPEPRIILVARSVVEIFLLPSKPEEPSPAILQDTDIAPTEVTPAATATNETIIDLKDDSEQCQGSTAKVGLSLAVLCCLQAVNR
jgi:hypothetical protein